jgi:hypothetical protein
MFKAYSTKRPRPIPAEFELKFVEGGWAKVNCMYGKRCSQRWFLAAGPQRLREARLAYRSAQRVAS